MSSIILYGSVARGTQTEESDFDIAVIIHRDKIIKTASEQRENADYLDFFVASKEEAEKQIESAKRFRGVVA